GHLAGAAYRGSNAGMRGGALLIDGRAGNEVGAGMRRGLVAVGGDTGDYPRVSMIAGSGFILGPPGGRPRARLKRGSVVALGQRPALLPTFRYDCDIRWVYLRLYLRQLKAWGFRVPDDAFNATYQRHSGDLVSLGKGEILCRV